MKKLATALAFATGAVIIAPAVAEAHIQPTIRPAINQVECNNSQFFKIEHGASGTTCYANAGTVTGQIPDSWHVSTGNNKVDVAYLDTANGGTDTLILDKGTERDLDHVTITMFSIL